MRNKQASSIFPRVNFSGTYKVLFFILVCIVIVYIRIFKNQFIWDDELYILNNPYLKSLSFDNVKSIFSSFFGGNYHPFTLISLAIDYKIGGIEPWPYQFTNILLHLCNTVLVYIYVKILLELHSSKPRKYTLIPVITALLFGIHTLQVESVAWISERKNVLYTFFFLASMVSYIKYLNDKLYKTYALSVLLFIFSVLSKGMAIPLSVCLIIVDYFAGRKLLSKQVILEKLPFIAISLIFGIIAVLAQHSSDSVQGVNIFSPIERVAFASYGFVLYLIKLCFPFHLSAFYPYPVRPGSLVPSQYYIFIAIILFIFYLIWRFYRHNKTIVFGVLFFIANISIVIQLLPVGEAIMADRYVYVASVGFFFIVGYFFDFLWQKKMDMRAGLIAVAILYVFIIGLKTYNRAGIWKDGLTLWNNAIKNYPENNGKAYHNRGNYYYNSGEFVKALEDYNRLLEIDPENNAAYIGIGLIKQSMNDMQGALDDFSKSISIRKSYEGYINRANVKIALQDFNGALKDLDTACQINPLRPDIYMNRGIIKMNFDSIANAIAEFTKAIGINNNNSLAYFYRGVAKMSLQDYAGAIADLDISIQLQPSADAFYYRGICKIYYGYNSDGCSDLHQSLLLGNNYAKEEIEQYCK